MKKKKTTDRSSTAAKPGRSRAKHARTPTGKKADPELRASAEKGAREGTRERMEEGHIMAGRTPPSQMPQRRASDKPRQVDDAIRSDSLVTEDEKLLQQPAPGIDFTRTDPWRVLRITGEIIEGFDTLANVQKGVTILNASYAERAVLHMQLKANDADEFERLAFDLLRGDVLKLKHETV